MKDFEARFRTLPEILEHSRERYGDRPLFGVKHGDEWRWMTYAEFAEQVDQARAGLAQLGLSAGDAVALIAGNRPAWAIAAYGCYGLGATVVPLYESQTDEAWQYILADSSATTALVASEEIASRLGSLRGPASVLEHVVVFDTERDSSSLSFTALLQQGAAHALSPAPVLPDDPAGFVYTSGTTGDPKGVLLSHRNMASNVSAILEVFPLEPTDCSLSFLPWAHAYGQMVELHVILANGASTAFAESPQTIVANMPEVRPTMLVSVPRVWNRVYDGVHQRVGSAGGARKRLFDAAIANAARRRDLTSRGRRSLMVEAKHLVLDRLVFAKIRAGFGGRLTYALTGGAAIAPDVAEFIDSVGVLVYEGYGLSETSPVVTTNWPGSRKLGTVGKPIPGVRVEIDEEASSEPGEGEIIVHGHNVMIGYHNLPKATAEVFTSDGGFRTGDLGRVDADGFLVITGRVTDAAVVCGPAAWHHGWARDDWNALAGGVAAGHVIECSTQTTGGNYSFFTEVPGMVRVGFPWAEVADD
ncbi:MAG: AMP-binding protein, partial [Gaiellales bacterium]